MLVRSEQMILPVMSSAAVPRGKYKETRVGDLRGVRKILIAEYFK